MNKLALAALAAFSPLVINPTAALAQAASQQAPVSAHAQLYDAMQAGVDQEALLDNTLNQLAPQLIAGNPQLAGLEKDHPGIVSALIANLRPVIRQYYNRLIAQYRPRMIATIASIMTEEESLALAGFYSSDLGKMVLKAATQSISVENMGREVATGEAISEGSINRDMAETGERAVAAMSPQQQAELTRVGLSTPGFLKLPRMQQELAPINVEMAGSPPTPEELASISAAAIKTIKSFLN